ncbi:hypothetical protein ARMGADRAFT_949743, partial [Armillaria gallica]
LVKQADKTGEKEEMVFTVTGAIMHMNLPPIERDPVSCHPCSGSAALTHNSSGMREKLRFLSQSITITGFNSMTFDDAINALKEIQHTGEWEFHQGQLLKWTPNQLQGYDVLELLNRYLRSQSKTERETGILIDNNVDPKGILARLAGNTMVHTKENVVRYYRGIINGGKKRYMMTKPHAFRTGNIVEAQFSIVFVKCKGDNVKMKMILQAIAMINCKHMMVSTTGDHRMYMTDCYISECKP